MRMMDLIAENRRIDAFAGRLARSPWQLNAVHEADAELLDLPDRPGTVLVVKTDALVEEIESGLYADPELIGWMAVTSNLSDLAAVGAEPLGVLLALTLPPGTSDEFVARLADGAGAACAAAHTFIVGGDTNEGTRLGLCGSAVGLVPRDGVLTRRGARPGDRLYLTGPAGLGSAYALSRLEGWAEPPAFRPAARLVEGRLLRDRARCCMDTSDGVLHTLDTLMRVNECRFVVDGHPEEVLHPAALGAARTRRLPPWLMLAGVHGEFELCFTVAQEGEAELLAAFACAGSRPVRLGEATAGDGIALRTTRGETALDTTAIRNASGTAGADPGAYVERLIAPSRSAAEEDGPWLGTMR